MVLRWQYSLNGLQVQYSPYQNPTTIWKFKENLEESKQSWKNTTTEKLKPQPKCPSTDEWINKTWNNYRKKIKINEMKNKKKWNTNIYIPGRRTLENIMLSERSHTLYDSIYTKCPKTEKSAVLQKVGCLGDWKEREIVSANGHKVSWGLMTIFWIRQWW